MEGSFGRRLRAQREQQQIPLADIAERTKIKLSLLEALERDDVSQWPTGIFRRSFVRSYAQAIGLDGDAVVREFLELYPDPLDEDVAAIVAAREVRRPPTRLGYLISSAFNALPGLRKAAPAEQKEAAASPQRARGFDFENIPPADEVPEVAPGHDLPMEAGPVLARASAACDEAEAASQPELDWQAADDGLMADFDLQPAATPDVMNEPMGINGHEPEMEETTPVASTLHHHSPAQVHDAEAPAARTTPSGPDYAAIAELCTRLARVVQPRDIEPVLGDAARLLDAVGVIVWMWDPSTRTLGQALAHGYSPDVLMRLPRVRWDSENAIADAFRSADTRIVRSSGSSTGAVVVPMVTGAGCAGVLALELQDRAEQREWVHAVAAILAAQFAALFGFQAMAEAVGA